MNLIKVNVRQSANKTSGQVDNYRVSQKLYLIFRLNFGATHLLITNMLLLPDSRDL